MLTREEVKRFKENSIHDLTEVPKWARHDTEERIKFDIELTTMTLEALDRIDRMNNAIDKWLTACEDLIVEDNGVGSNNGSIWVTTMNVLKDIKEAGE